MSKPTTSKASSARKSARPTQPVESVPAPESSPPPDEAVRASGGGIVKANLLVTLIYTGIAVPLALIDRRSLIVVVVVMSFAVFIAGVAAFISSFFTAAERSRTDEIGAANLYVLTGRTAPRSVRVVMLSCLAMQVVVAFAVAIIGLSSDAWTNASVNEQRNPMAFAALIPMFGLGLNGVWAARHGAFAPRRRVTPTRPQKRR